MAPLHYLNKHNNTATAQLHVGEAVTPNGATPVTATYTYPLAFKEAPRIIGVNHDGSAALTATATSTATVLTFRVVALSGNTTPVNVSVTLEGQYAEGT